jgi:hypothetical protein
MLGWSSFVIVYRNFYLIMLKYILYIFGLELPENASPMIEVGFNMAIICLIILICFINVFGYLLVLYLLQIYDLKNKYPKFKWLIDRYSKYSLMTVIIEAVIGFSFLILLIFIGFSPLFRLI